MENTLLKLALIIIISAIIVLYLINIAQWDLFLAYPKICAIIQINVKQYQQKKPK